MDSEGLFEEQGSNEKMFEEAEYGEKQLEGGYFTWPKAMDTLLLKVLQEQKLKGLKDDRNFQGEAYRVAIETINKEFNCNITKEKIINRLKTLKEIMNLALEALKKSGISWSDAAKKIEASNEVWNVLIKEKPKMKRIRDKEIPNLELLRDIYEKDRASGGKAKTAKERLRQWDEAITVDEVNRVQADNVVDLEDLENLSPTNPQSSNGVSSLNKSNKKPPSKSGVKRKFEDLDPIQDGLKSVTSSLSDIAQALTIANENNLKSITGVYSASEIYTELEKHGLSDGKLLEAVELLKTNYAKADTFFSSPDRLKRQWLERHGFYDD